MKYYKISIRVVRVASIHTHTYIYKKFKKKKKLIFTIFSLKHRCGTSDKNDAFCSSNLGDLEVNNNQGNNEYLWHLFERYLGSSISRRIRCSFRMSLVLALSFSFYLWYQSKPFMCKYGESFKIS